MNDIEIALEDLDTLVEIARQHTGIASWLGLVQSALIMKEALEKQLNGGWIPVSDRLPREDEEVLITLAHGKATWAYLYQGEWNSMFSTYPIERVIAWQPLPEAYKEVENE